MFKSRSQLDESRTNICSCRTASGHWGQTVVLKSELTPDRTFIIIIRTASSREHSDILSCTHFTSYHRNTLFQGTHTQQHTHTHTHANTSTDAYMKPDCLRDGVYLWKWTENCSERLELSEPYHIIAAFNVITTCNNNDNNDNSNKLYIYSAFLKSLKVLCADKQAEAGNSTMLQKKESNSRTRGVKTRRQDRKYENTKSRQQYESLQVKEK